MLRPRIVVLALAALIVVACFTPGCDDLITETLEITTAGNPTAEFTVTPDSGCVPLTVLFRDQSSGPIDEWYWDFGDGDTLTAFTDSGGFPHTYDSTGSFTVTLIVTDTDLENAFSTRIYKRRVVVGQTIDSMRVLTDSVCQSDTVTFEAFNPAGVAVYNWRYGDGTQYTGDSAVKSHSYANAGVYEVTLIATGECGTTTLTDSVTVLQCAMLGYTVDDYVRCIGDDSGFTFLADAWSNSEHPVDTFFWNFGDGDILEGMFPEVAHEYAAAGDYQVSLRTHLNGGGYSEYVDSVTAYNGLTAAFTAAPTQACFSSSYQFQVLFESGSTGKIDSLEWNFGDGTFAYNDSTPLHAYVTPGRYTVGLTIVGCADASESFVSKTNLVVLADVLSPAYSLSKDTIDLIDTTQDNRTIVFTDLTDAVVYDSIVFDFGDGEFGKMEPPTVAIGHAYDTVAGEFLVVHKIYNYCGEKISADTATVTVIDTSPTK